MYSNNKNNNNISNTISASSNASNMLPKAANVIQNQQPMVVDDVS